MRGKGDDGIEKGVRRVKNFSKNSEKYPKFVYCFVYSLKPKE